MKYQAVIPGNYITRWLNLFSKAVSRGEYKKISYNLWTELTNLSKANKLKILVEKDSTCKSLEKIYFLFPYNADKTYITLTKDCPFLIFLETELFKDGTVDIEWEKYNEMGDFTFANGMIYNNKGEYIGDANNITYSVDSSNISNTTTTVSSTPYSNSINIAYGGTINDTWTIGNEFDTVSNTLKELSKTLNDHINKENKDENKMNTNDMFNFDFGVISDNKIRMSMYGYAIPNEAGKYVAYDLEHNRMMDVQILNFNCAGMFYKIPKPLTKITFGDVVFHNGVPMFVCDINEDRTRFTVIDPKEGTEKTILPAHSPFGFDYLTCLVSLMDSFDMPADENNPFGNMLPLLLMSNGQTSDQTLPLYLMMNGEGNLEWNNPYMLMAMSNSKMDMNNPLMMMAMMKMFNK